MNKIYGLLGRKLTHSFSKSYFTEKFEKENITNHEYRLFEIENITEISSVLNIKGLCGFNITIPYKQDIIPYLNELDVSASKVGAVNVVKVTNDGLVGYNSDYYGFLTSLQKWIGPTENIKALVLGNGGAAKAVIASLETLNIDYKLVSRRENPTTFTYQEVTSKSLIRDHKLIVNTTPLGMYPNSKSYPAIDYNQLTAHHFLYDLVYNPETTQFLSKGLAVNAKAKNGLEMLHLQAEKSWEIWK